MNLLADARHGIRGRWSRQSGSRRWVARRCRRRGPVAVREIAGLDRVVSGCGQSVCQARRHLSVDQQVHAAPSGTTLMWLAVNAP